jgi:hypothetical protein
MTISNTHLKILQKLVELWRRPIQADEVMNKTPVREQAEERPSKDASVDQIHRDAIEN